MLVRRFLLACFLAACMRPIPVTAQSLGTFVGQVAVEWLDDGRRMKLLQPFSYVDPAGTRWDAPTGSIIDGASIPRPAWSFIGGPFEGKYRKASVIHDVACEQKIRPWQDVHRAFYAAMLAADENELVAKIMYGAVFAGGPRWDRQKTLTQVPIRLAEQVAQNLQSEAKAEEQAEVKISPIPRRECPSGRECFYPKELPPISAVVTATFSAPRPALSQSDLERLKAFVEARNPSLEEIEAFKP